MARKVAAPLGEFVRGLGGGLCCLNQRIREFFRKKIAKCSAPSQALRAEFFGSQVKKNAPQGALRALCLQSQRCMLCSS